MDNSPVKGDNVSPLPPPSDPKAVSTVIPETAAASNDEAPADKKIDAKPDNKTPEVSKVHFIPFPGSNFSHLVHWIEIE